MSKGTVHQVAAGGFATGTNDLYDRARPTYPAGALQKIHDSLGQQGPLTLLEPGSGTGIFTRLVLAPPQDAGYPSFNIKALVGIEPSSGMRESWQKGIDRLPQEATSGKRVESVNGTFDDFSQAGSAKGEVDGIVIAQAFHWCPDYDSALREIAAYLKPGQPLILIWNLENQGLSLSSSVQALFERHDRGTPQYARMWWRKMFDTAAYKELFETQEETKHPWSVGMTEQQLVDRVFSKSYLTEQYLNGDARVQFEKDLRGLIHDKEKVWIDKEKGIFEYKYNTDVVVCRKKA